MPAEGGTTYPFAKSSVKGKDVMSVIVVALCHFMPAECGATTPPKVSVPGVILGLVLGVSLFALLPGRKMVGIRRRMTVMKVGLGRAAVSRKNISVNCMVLVLVSWLAGGGLVVVLVVVDAVVSGGLVLVSMVVCTVVARLVLVVVESGGAGIGWLLGWGAQQGD